MQIDSAAAARASGYPVIECRRLPKQEGYACDLWIIDWCPFCCQTHTHGAGEGFRTSHCADPIPTRSFYLIEREESR